MIRFYLLILLMSVLGFVTIKILINKFSSKKDCILKIAGVIASIIMFIVYMIGISVPIGYVRGLNMFSPFGDNIFKTVIGLLLVWFTYSSTMAITLNQFYKFKNVDNVIKFFAIPIFLLDIVFLKTYMISINEGFIATKIDLKSILITIQFGICLSIVANTLVDKNYFEIKSRKEVIWMFVTIIAMILSFLPPYSIQAFYGFIEDSTVKFSGFSYEHRLVLYLSIIIPVIIYFVLRDKDEKTKRFSMIYLSIGLLWAFLLKYELKDFLDPHNWPVHLCHTVMYIMPLCLIFKLNKLYYFTFFVNVMGAFLAMAMPDLGGSNVVSTQDIIFWMNHFGAFFMPMLVIALGLFKRPQMREWIYSMVAFVIYFVFVLIINALLGTDFFYINGDFITDKLGSWAENTQNFVWKLKVGNKVLVLYPIYQTLYFAVYGLITLGMWFIYEQLFEVIDMNEDRRRRNKDYKKIQEELNFLLKGKEGELEMGEDVKPCLELKNFSKKYGTNKFYSVKDVSFKVNGGEIFGFLGPNGAGKSTIIKSIVGIQTITDGSIEICGYDVEKQSVQSKKETGFVPDHYALYENLTGREYINYIADLYGVSKQDRDERIGRYVKNFQLEVAFDNQMKTYSHGMKQKITIMAALVHNPKVWILDEPLTGLDPTSVFQVKECMKEHAENGNIVFFSSHIIDVVEKICDRIAIIKKGTLLADVKVADLDNKNINLEDFYLATINEKTSSKNNSKSKKEEDL